MPSFELIDLEAHHTKRHKQLDSKLIYKIFTNSFYIGLLSKFERKQEDHYSSVLSWSDPFYVYMYLSSS